MDGEETGEAFGLLTLVFEILKVMSVPPKVVASKKRVPWTKLQVSVMASAVVYTVFLLWLWNATNSGPEYNGIVLANQYAPQILWCLPSLILILTAWIAGGKRRWLAATPLPSLIIVAIPLMGLRGLSPANVSRTNMNHNGAQLRVLTYNIEFGRKSSAVLKIIEQERPDIFAAQDVGGEFESLFRAVHPEWNIQRDKEFLIATKFPLKSFERFDLPGSPINIWSKPGYVRSIVRIRNADVAIYSTHFDTPRRTLEALRHRENSGIGQLESSGRTRLFQASVLSQALAKENLPTIVCGDFNASEISLTCQLIIRSGMRDAFSEAGNGYGYTFGHALRFQYSFLRIDHIFVSSDWKVRSCYVGDSSGSDHRPVIADLDLSR